MKAVKVMLHCVFCDDVIFVILDYKTRCKIYILSPCMLLHLLSITNSCTQLKYFHNFHLKLHTLKMFVMRTKTVHIQTPHQQARRKRTHTENIRPHNWNTKKQKN